MLNGERPSLVKPQDPSQRAIDMQVEVDEARSGIGIGNANANANVNASGNSKGS